MKKPLVKLGTKIIPKEELDKLGVEEIIIEYPYFLNFLRADVLGEIYYINPTQRLKEIRVEYFEYNRQKDPYKWYITNLVHITKGVKEGESINLKW